MSSTTPKPLTADELLQRAAHIPDPGGVRRWATIYDFAVRIGELEREVERLQERVGGLKRRRRRPYNRPPWWTRISQSQLEEVQ